MANLDESPAPVAGEVDWTKYVLSNLREGEFFYDEQNNIIPKCDGLLRVCQSLFGDILGLKTEVIKWPTEGCRRSTVKSTVVCKRYSDEEIVEFDSVSDVDGEDIPEMFYYNLTPSAETKSQGRAVRKMMFLSCYTAEEIQGAKKLHKSPTQQNEEVSMKIKTITNMLNNLKIDKSAFEQMFEVDSLDSINLDSATKLINELNVFDLDNKKIPKEIKVRK